MNKCELCQQINKILAEVQDYKQRSLAQILFNLKGFEASSKADSTILICGNCTQGLENFSSFWETIPEAQTINDVNIDDLQQNEQTSQHVSYSPGSYIYSNENITTHQEPQEYVPFTKSIHTKHKIMQKRLRRKRQKVDENICAAASSELLPKRVRRQPKRFEDFYTNSDKKIVNDNEGTAASEMYIKDSLHVATVRSKDGQDLGKLVQVKGNGNHLKIRIICQFCAQIFCLEKDFQTHLETHNKIQLQESQSPTKSYSFCCKLCDKSFVERNIISRHYTLVHTKERSLKCQYCDASFKYKFNLDYHMAKHVPKKRFECDFCKKNFLMRYELKIHLRTHTKERPYKCEHCPFACSHKSNLKTHQKAKHPENESHDASLSKGGHTDRKKDPGNILKENIFKPPQSLLELELGTNVHFDNKSEFSNALANKADSLENNATEVSLPEAEISLQSLRAAVKLPKCNDSQGEKLLVPSETCIETLKIQPKLCTFQLNSSILKMLPSPTLLSLKKWPKSYQSSSCEIESTNPLEVDNSSDKNRATKENMQYSNFENTTDSSKCITKYMPRETNTRNSKFRNISQLTKPSSFQYHVQSKLETAHFDLNIEFNNELTKAQKSQICNLVKVSESPVKIKSVRNIKSTTESPTGDSTATHKVAGETSSQNFMEPQFVSHTQQTYNNCLENVSAACNTSNTDVQKYANISQRSLLKPIIKPQQISTLSIRNHMQNETVLPEKPLITKMEILPPFEPIIRENPLVAGLPTNIIKPPTEYKHQCSHCYKYFKTKSSLTKHIRTHTGEKPYKCSLCPKSYADPSNYKKHKLLHKNTTDALNISRSDNAVPLSPAYSTISDPDPDGIEVMETINKCVGSATEEDDFNTEDASLSSSTMETNMWHDVLENILRSDDIRENIKRNLQGLNNTIWPAAIQAIDLNTISYPTEDID